MGNLACSKKSAKKYGVDTSLDKDMYQNKPF